MDRLIFPDPRNRRIYNWFFVAIAVFVVAFKFKDLFLPYFWDELGVYTQGVNYQYLHGLSLMPASVPVLYSRGHPLFFTFINALVWKIFGNRIFVAHIFSVFVSLLLLLVVYVKTAKYFNPLTAIVSVVLLAVQPVFLAQSSLVLPEIMLSLFIFLSLTSYYEKKCFLFAAFASMAILTKESAVVLPISALVFSFVQWVLLKNKPVALKAGNIILTLLPYGIFGIFLLIQKQQNGWYFFPYHMQLVSFSPTQILSQFSRIFDFVFWHQGRYWCAKIILVGIGICLLTNRLNWKSAAGGFLTLSGIFIFAFFSFSALNFYMDRYAVAVLFPVMMMVAASLTSISTNNFFLMVVTLLLCANAFQYVEETDFQYDADLGYRRQVHVVQQAIDYVAEVSKPGETMCGNFPAFVAMHFPAGGYLTRKTMNAKAVGFKEADYFLFSPEGGALDVNRNLNELTEIKDFKDGFAEVKIYKVRKKQE